MEENLNQQKSLIPAPSKSEVVIRTMESDIKAIEQGGGEMAVPQSVSFEELKTETKFNIPGYTGPEKAIFTPTATIAQEESSVDKSGKWKIIGIIIGILAVIAVFGFLGYFIISLWLFPKQMPAVQ